MSFYVAGPHFLGLGREMGTMYYQCIHGLNSMEIIIFTVCSFSISWLQKRAFRRIRISPFNFPSQYVALHIQFNQREIQTLTFANVTIHLSNTQYLSLSKHCHMRNVTIKLSNLSIPYVRGGRTIWHEDSKNGQFGTAIFFQENFH